MKRLALMAATLLAGCVQTPSAEVVKDGGSIGQGVTRVDDQERGVTCYVGYKAGGIDCLPTEVATP